MTTTLLTWTVAEALAEGLITDFKRLSPTAVTYRFVEDSKRAYIEVESGQDPLESHCTSRWSR